MTVVAQSAKIASGKWKVRWFPKTASVAIVTGTLVEFGSGYVKQATTTAGANNTPLAGIFIGTSVTASSSDYASNTKVPVLVPADPMAEAEIVVGTGSLAATDVGKGFDIDSDAEVTVSTTTNEPVVCTEYISATLGKFRLKSMTPIVA